MGALLVFYPGVFVEVVILGPQGLDLDVLAQVEHLHQRIWSFPDRGPCYPARLYQVQGRIGGTPLVALAGDRCVGFLLGYAAYDEQGTYIWSQIMGVHPEWRGRGIARQLKWRQREVALDRGVERIEWTYDPLEAGNGRLNLTLLGARGVAYERDVYGGVTGPRFTLEADRVRVRWDLLSQSVKAAAAGETPAWTGALAGAAPVLDAGGPRGDQPERVELHREERYLLAALPPSIQDLLAREVGGMELGRAWRRELRRVCEHYLGRGWELVGVHRQGKGSRLVLRGPLAGSRDDDTTI